jgi:hypothetical protein
MKCDLGARATEPRVRIPPSQPHSLACLPTFWRGDEIAAWGAMHKRRWTWRMATAAAERQSRIKFSVRDFGRSIDDRPVFRGEPLRSSGRTPDASNSARVSLSEVQSLLLRAPERVQFDSSGHCDGAEVCRLAASGDRLDDPRRQERQSHHPPHVTTAISPMPPRSCRPLHSQRRIFDVPVTNEDLMIAWHTSELVFS